jgi:hypothetical protein
MKGTYAPVKHGLAMVVAMVVVTLSFLELTLVCFSADGHVAAEAAMMIHHDTPFGTAGTAAVGTSVDSHGPCVDAAFTGSVNGAPSPVMIVSSVPVDVAGPAAIPRPPAHAPSFSTGGEPPALFGTVVLRI